MRRKFFPLISAILVLACVSGSHAWVSGGPEGTTRYYAMPSVADQGGTTGRSVKNMIDGIGATKKATLVFAHSTNATETTYTFTTSETTTGNITVEIEPGALLDGAGTLAIHSPEHIKASPKQQIFGSSITIIFTETGNVYSEWWGAVADGNTNSTAAIQSATEAGHAIFNKGIYMIDGTSYSNPSGVVCTDAGIYCTTDNRCLIGAGYGETVIKLIDNANSSILFIDDVSSLRVTGISFDGNVSNQTEDHHMICLGDSNEIILEECRIYDSSMDGLYLYGCEDIWIRNNHFENNYRDGITNGYKSSKKLHIINNKFKNHTHVIANGDDHNSISIDLIVFDSIISGNQIYNTWTGIAIETSDDYDTLVDSDDNIISENIVKNETVSPAPWGIKILATTDNAHYNIISKNIIKGNFAYPISLYSDPNETCDADHTTIADNIISDSNWATSAGIYLRYSERCNVVNNIISNMHAYGISLYHTNRSNVNNNNIYECSLDTNYSRGAIYVEESNYNTINNNMIDGNSHHYGIAVTSNSNYNRMGCNNILPGTNINSADDKYDVTGTAKTGNLIDGSYYRISGGITTSGTGEQTLRSWYIPQDAHLYTKGIKIFGAGNKEGTNGGKNIRFYVGSSYVEVIDPNTNNESAWRFEMHLYFQWNDSQRSSHIGIDGESYTDPNSFPVWNGIEHTYSAFTNDLSASTTLIKFTGECMDPNDTISQILFEVTDLPISKDL